MHVCVMYFDCYISSMFRHLTMCFIICCVCTTTIIYYMFYMLDIAERAIELMFSLYCLITDENKQYLFMQRRRGQVAFDRSLLTE